MDKQADGTAKVQSIYASLSQAQRFTLLGAILVVIAAFLPAYSFTTTFLNLSDNKSENLIDSFGFWYWIILTGAVVAAYFAYIKDYVKTFFFGAIASVIAVIKAIMVYFEVAKEYEYIAEYTSFGMGWSWLLLIAGLGLILFATFAYAKDALAFAKKISNDAVSKAKEIASTPPAKEEEKK